MGRNSRKISTFMPASLHKPQNATTHSFLYSTSSFVFLFFSSRWSQSLPTPCNPPHFLNQQVPSLVSNSVHYPCYPHNSILPTSPFLLLLPVFELAVELGNVGVSTLTQKSLICSDRIIVIIWPVRGWVVKHRTSSRRSRIRVAAWWLHSASRKTWKVML